MVQIHIKGSTDAALPGMQPVSQNGVREFCLYGVGQNSLTGEWICLPSSNIIPSTSYTVEYTIVNMSHSFDPQGDS